MADSTCHHFNISINISQVSGTPIPLIHDQQQINNHPKYCLNNGNNYFGQEKNYQREHAPSWGVVFIVVERCKKDLVTIVATFVSLVMLVVLWRVGHHTHSGQLYCGHQRENTCHSPTSLTFDKIKEVTIELMN